MNGSYNMIKLIKRIFRCICEYFGNNDVGDQEKLNCALSAGVVAPEGVTRAQRRSWIISNITKSARLYSGNIIPEHYITEEERELLSESIYFMMPHSFPQVPNGEEWFRTICGDVRLRRPPFFREPPEVDSPTETKWHSMEENGAELEESDCGRYMVLRSDFGELWFERHPLFEDGPIEGEVVTGD